VPNTDPILKGTVPQLLQLRLADEKITSKTDVFSIGQVMWNLIMNLPGKDIDVQEPFFDNAGEEGALLVSGQWYSNDDLSAETGKFLSGRSPYEASSMYSDELKDLARLCLRYYPADRPTVAELQRLIETHRKDGVERRARTGNNLKLTMPWMKDRFDVRNSFVESESGEEIGAEIGAEAS
jgi:serine/threonine protein kinase